MQNPVLDNLLVQNLQARPVKEFLHQLTEEYPYYTPAHFFLLQQLAETDAGYSKQAAKTALLFNNPYWLQFQLQQTQQPVASGQTRVIAMFDDNTDNDDDSAIITPVNTDAKLINLSDTLQEQYHEKSDGHSFAESAVSADENADVQDGEEEQASETPLITEEPSKINLAASLKNAEDLSLPAFEPMHLVDYFASQGIKLSDEVLTTDKLGKQLKSFTEWLKTMKKIHTPAGTGSEGTDVAVQAMAEKSNVENEVVTEAMAEVFAQQGKTAKAVEVYQKLSLLNPSKSAYFAGLIEKIKGE